MGKTLNSGLGTGTGTSPQQDISQTTVDSKISELEKNNMLEQLKNAGVKFNPDDVIFVTKDKSGQLIWLEKGNNNAGLKHIIKQHEKNFNDKLGISSQEIQSTIKDIVTSGEIQYSRLKITNGKKGYEKLYLYKKNIISFPV